MFGNLSKRAKNLWYLSGLNLKKEPSVIHKIQESLGINRATIVDMDDPIDKALSQFK